MELGYHLKNGLSFGSDSFSGGGVADESRGLDIGWKGQEVDGTKGFLSNVLH
jgi:hypothetical protein